MRCLIGLVLVGALALPVTDAYAGVVFEIETSDHDQSPPTRASSDQPLPHAHHGRIETDGRNLRVPVTGRDGAPDGAVVFRPDDGSAGRLHLVNEAGAVQFVHDGAEGAQTPAGAPQLDPEALALMPEATRRAIEEGMRNAAAAQKQVERNRDTAEAASVRRVGAGPPVMGIPTIAWDVFVANLLRWRVYVADPARVDGGSDMASALYAFGNFLSRPNVPARMRAMTFHTHMERFGGGVPLGFDQYGDDGAATRRSRVTAISYGEEVPVNVEAPDRAWSVNRSSGAAVGTSLRGSDR